MDNAEMKMKAEKAAKSAETLDELVKIYERAVAEHNYQLCEVVRLEIKRCITQQPLLIPAGQVDGLILDPMAVLLGR